MDSNHKVRVFLANYIEKQITKEQYNDISCVGIEPYDTDTKVIRDVIRDLYRMCIDYPLFYHIWKDFSNHIGKDWMPVTKEQIPSMIESLMDKYPNLC